MRALLEVILLGIIGALVYRLVDYEIDRIVAYRKKKQDGRTRE